MITYMIYRYATAQADNREGEEMSMMVSVMDQKKGNSESKQMVRGNAL